MPGTRHKTLNHSQKAKIVEERNRRVSEGRSTSQKDIAIWAKQNFCLDALPSQPVISRLLFSPFPLSVTKDQQTKRNRRGKLPEMEASLAAWVRSQHAAKVCVNGDMIKIQGGRILNGINNTRRDGEKLSLNFSTGWLCNFQKRWDLKCYTLHGESNDADDEAIARSLPFLQHRLKNYNINDIWNADETGLNYRLAPCTTIAHEQMSGRKKDKVRMTYLVCANADGTEKFPLMVIGQAERPRCFKKKYGQELGFDYWNNKKAWMRSTIFFLWLQLFHAYIGSTRDRKVILLLDNCSAHGKPEILPVLRNVEVLFLPANTTSKLQPMDAGIISSFKKRYRKMQYNRALDLIDANVSNIYGVNQLTAMRWTRSIWDELPGKIIFNCWKKTGLLDENLGVGNAEMERVDDEEDNDLNNLIRQLAPEASRMSIQNLLNRDDNEPCVEEFSIQNLVEQAVVKLDESSEQRNALEDAHPDEDVYAELPSIEERLKALSITKWILQDEQSADRSAVRAVVHAQMHLRHEKISSMKQRRITDFFKITVYSRVCTRVPLYA